MASPENHSSLPLSAPRGLNPAAPVFVPPQRGERKEQHAHTEPTIEHVHNIYDGPRPRPDRHGARMVACSAKTTGEFLVSVKQPVAQRLMIQ